MEAGCYIREWKCANGICMKTKFFIREEAISWRPGTRRHDRAVRQAEKGAMEAKHELAKLLNENFRAAVDYHMVLTYSSEGYDRLVMRAGTDDEDAIYFAAKAECKNFIRRCRRACKKAGIEFRYAFVTSDRDGDTLEPVRVHHHLVVNAEAAAICIEKWMEGEVRKPKELYGDKYGDLTALAEYMIAQVRYFPGEKRYTPSRNLRKVEPGALIKARNPEAELRVPKGCKLIYRSENYVGRPQYVRYYRPKADKLREAKGQKREGEAE